MKKTSLILSGILAIGLIFTGCGSNTTNSQTTANTPAATSASSATAVETTTENVKNTGTETRNNPTNKEAISEKKAKEIALARVPGAKESDMIAFEKDYDHNDLEYDGKIRYEGTEYEFEIDGYTGEIRSWETETIHD